MEYTDENRGKIQHSNRIHQMVEFSGIRYGSITPTDVDGFFEKADKAFVFFEFKMKGCEMPSGQRIALERVVNALRSAGKEAVLFECEHDTKPSENVKAAQAIVRRVFWNGRWHKGKGLTVKAQTDKFMAFVGSLL